jgi:hypothetical protein
MQCGFKVIACLAVWATPPPQSWWRKKPSAEEVEWWIDCYGTVVKWLIAVVHREFSIYNMPITSRDECSRATPMMSCSGLGAIPVFEQVRWGKGQVFVAWESPSYLRRCKEALNCRLQQWGVESPRAKAQWSSWLHSAPGVVSLLYHGWEKGVTGIILRGFP